FFTWFALPCMWQYFGIAVARHVYGAPGPEVQPGFREGTEWGGFCFAFFNAVCFVVAFLLPWLARKTSRKGVHMIALACGGLGLLSTYFAESREFLLLSMTGVGIAWASILSMPYVILSSSVPPERMGVYMGVFNLFIVIPQVVMSLVMPQVIRFVLGDDPLRVVMFGGAVMLLGALSVVIVRDEARPVPVGDVIRGDEQEPLTTTMTAQPVPSTGLVDDEGK
ncbi:MAG TPA: MFS transporter, partial [Pyrinomonadaceae bacterium]|nr:MFS transporter [Pyrinomonadaceae bacterium]